MPKRGEHAVVLGASIGGLLAARVLADFYENVTVVERDVLPTAAVNRRGVPQGRQIHAIAARGTQILEELFPIFLPPGEAIRYAAFLLGTFAPFSRASESPIAMACLRLFTVPPLPPLPDLSVPFFFRCIALLTDLLAASPYFLLDLFLPAMELLLDNL